MKHYLLFYCLICCTVITINEAHAYNYEELLDRVSVQLFGRLWKFDENCDDQRNDSTILADDKEAEEFYNAKSFDPKLKKNGQLTTQDLDDLNYKGIKSRIYTSIICSANSWGYANEFLFKLSNEPIANESHCHASIDNLYKFVINLDTIKHKNQSVIIQDDNWFKFNSIGRIPPGLIFHSHIWQGDFSGCTKIPEMRYCFGAYRSKYWPQVIQPGQSSFRVGLCLPKTCNNKLLKSELKKLDTLIKHNLIDSLGVNKDKYQLTDVHCPPVDGSYFRTAFNDSLSTSLLALALVWFILLIYSTAFSSKALLLKGFNIRNNWIDLVKVKQSSSNLSALDGVKVVALCWIMVTHNHTLFRSYVSNFHEIRDTWNGSLFATIVLQGQHAVPVFFIISGFLVGYKWLKKKEESFSMNVTQFIFHRYMRLAPMYILVYVYVKKFYHLLGSGPFWDYGVSRQSETRQCMLESWWVPFLMLANFIQPFSHCVLTGWHIANDFQIYFALPALLYLYKRSQLLGRICTILSFLGSHLYHAWNYHSSTRYSYAQLANDPYIFGPQIIAERMVYDYVNPFGRIGTYFIGVLLADVIGVVNEKPTGKGNFSLVLSVLLKSVAVGCIAMRAQDKYLLEPYSKGIVYPLLRFLVELGWISLLYTLLVKIEQSVENAFIRFFKFPMWGILVKMNYTIILTHFSVARYLVQSQTNLLVFSWINFLQLTSFSIFVSYLVGVCIYLAVEVPLTGMVQLLIAQLTGWFSSSKNSDKKI